MRPTRILIIFLSILSFNSLNAQNPKVEYFNLEDVRLLDSPFKHAEDLDKKYMLELDADRLLAPFLREAGLTPKAESYGNWENTGLDGHIGGHYLSALSMMYAATGDSQIKARLDYMISELKKCQDKNRNGYIGGVPGGATIWNEIKNGDIKAGGFDLNSKWVPLYNIHKTYAGLRDAYLFAHNQEAKEMLIKMTDWAVSLVSALSEKQIQDMLRSEHGGLNETFADVADITGNEKYMKLAKQFSHHLILEPLIGHEDKLTGMHANTQIPKVIGFKRISEINGDKSWEDAARFFWDTVIENRSVAIGGNSTYEHFNPTDDFSNMIYSNQGPETCNTHNMLKLSKMLYHTSMDEKYIEYYERALYNHILSSQNPEQGGFVYFTQMRPGHYRVYSQPQTSFWCCVGSGLENHAKYGEFIYTHTDNTLYVNLFIASQLNWKKEGIEIIQHTTFPEESKTELTIKTKKSKQFTLNLRYPEWVKAGELKVNINGKSYSVTAKPGEYVAINRKWKNNDKVSMEMPMHLSIEQMPDKSDFYSILYGPIVLAAKTDTVDQTGLFSDDSRGGHIANGKFIPLNEMPIIVSEPDQILSLVKPIENKPLAFTLSGLHSKKYSEMELIPFYHLHESRYILYWQQTTEEKLAQLKKELEEKERIAAKLNAITIDKVTCGEQQPESDHFIKSEDSRTGTIHDIHWREARGYFSYQLRNNDKDAKQLAIKYLIEKGKRSFDIIINDQLVESVDIEGNEDAMEETRRYPIPSAAQTKDILTVKIAARDGSTTAKTLETRLLKE